ncbi:PEP-CTERM domain protein [Oopsacas minuta]|uniref:PEP-CTERM domain protein n=1 Tax=Oopsacas minuta TaxID=111878 RepID=A0AAV7K8Q9_9METZ|nr:PEP-CTERM domain protein [Oopsacas minuta]
MAEKEILQGNSDYLDLLKFTLTQVDDKYENLIQSINSHKSKLQDEIHDLEREYIELEDVRGNELAKLRSVMSTYESGSRNDNRLNEVQTRVLTGIQREIDYLGNLNHEKTVRFRWDGQLEGKIAKLGNIEVNKKLDKDEPVEDKEEIHKEDSNAMNEDISSYKAIKYPKVESYSVGSEIDQLSNPAGVAVCQDNSFFVADYNNNRVSAYTQWGKLKFSFQHPGMMGLVNNMDGPWGLCCHGNNIYVTESRTSSKHAAVKMFDMQGKYCDGIVRYGNKEGEFIDPTGLDFDSRKKELYVCDRLNNRIQVFSHNLVFKGIFTDRLIYQPRDIKVCLETVYILDENDPCIQMFDKITSRIKIHLITQGLKRDVLCSWFFTIDVYGNLLISDKDSNLICIFNQEGKLLYKLGNRETINFLKPAGIAINASGNIISVSEKPMGCIQIL